MNIFLANEIIRELKKEYNSVLLVDITDVFAKHHGYTGTTEDFIVLLKMLKNENYYYPVKELIQVIEKIKSTLFISIDFNEKCIQIYG